MLIFVPRHCVEGYLFPSQNCGWLYVPVDCLEWRGLVAHRVLLVPTTWVFSYYSKEVLGGTFCHLAFTVAQSRFAVSIAAQFLLVATDGLFGSFRLDGRVHSGKLHLVALRPSVISLNDVMDIREMFYDYSYDLETVIMA